MVNSHRWGGAFSSSLWSGGMDKHDYYPSSIGSSLVWHGSVDDGAFVPNKYYPPLPYYYFKSKIPNYSPSSCDSCNSSEERRKTNQRLNRSNSLTSLSSCSTSDSDNY